jgi:hypothetical protein
MKWFFLLTFFDFIVSRNHLPFLSSLLKLDPATAGKSEREITKFVNPSMAIHHLRLFLPEESFFCVHHSSEKAVQR